MSKIYNDDGVHTLVVCPDYAASEQIDFVVRAISVQSEFIFS